MSVASPAITTCGSFRHSAYTSAANNCHTVPCRGRRATVTVDRKRRLPPYRQFAVKFQIGKYGIDIVSCLQSWMRSPSLERQLAAPSGF